MKPSVIIAASVVVALGLGFAAGHYFTPAPAHAESLALTVAVTAPKAHTAQNSEVPEPDAPPSTDSSSASSSTQDLQMVLKETNVYQLYKGLTNYADKIPAA